MLAGNARMTVADLARQVGMSSPSIADRLRRLEESGVVRGYTLDIDPVSDIPEGVVAIQGSVTRGGT